MSVNNVTVFQILQLRNKSRHPGGKLPLVDELLETKDVKQFESKLLEKFNILAESLAESDSDNNSDSQTE